MGYSEYCLYYNEEIGVRTKVISSTIKKGYFSLNIHHPDVFFSWGYEINWSCLVCFSLGVKIHHVCSS